MNETKQNENRTIVDKLDQIAGKLATLDQFSNFSGGEYSAAELLFGLLEHANRCSENLKDIAQTLSSIEDILMNARFDD